MMNGASRARIGAFRDSLPTRSYFVCGTPRSGSTLLALSLASTGLVGRAGEFFSKETTPDWAAGDYRAYVTQMLTTHSRGGVFGAKLLHTHLDDFLGKLRGVEGWEALDGIPLLGAAFPRPSFIWISRRDVTAQAVSWLKAHQTREFYVGDRRRTGATPVFDFGALQRLVGELSEGNLRWRRWFAANRIEPYSISYEDIAPDPVEATKRVLDFLGVDVPSSVNIRISPLSVKQANAVNEEWITRYRALAECPTDSEQMLPEGTDHVVP
jgi:LPS sulfotransferase NodH